VKNPLAAIKGLSAHMASQATDPKMAERLSIVAAEADRLRGIVDGFLSFSRGLDELSVSKAKPYELARELSLLLETRAADAQLTLEVTGSVDAALNADVRKLRQVLLNLVLNAMQASPPGETVTMHVGEKCDADGFLRIQVRDHGAGMSPEVLERIRKPYFTTKEGGTGLGVAVARGLVRELSRHRDDGLDRSAALCALFSACAEAAPEASAVAVRCAGGTLSRAGVTVDGGCFCGRACGRSGRRHFRGVGRLVVVRYVSRRSRIERHATSPGHR
jgi:hypothetical protein